MKYLENIVVKIELDVELDFDSCGHIEARILHKICTGPLCLSVISV